MARVLDGLLDVIGYIALGCAGAIMIVIATASFFIYFIRAGR